jgi:hypothetical protein
VLEHFLVQLSAITTQVTYGFILHRRHNRDAHPVALVILPDAKFVPGWMASVLARRLSRSTGILAASPIYLSMPREHGA